MVLPNRSSDVIVVGAGFGGLYLTHLLRSRGKSVRTFEASDEPGGTWNYNRYPGARVDIVSRDYSFKFDPQLYNEWNWSELYAPQPELLKYANHVADRYGLRESIQFQSAVTGAKWDDGEKRWKVTVAVGSENGDKETQEWDGKWLVLAIGALYIPNWPGIEGLDTFKGERHHTSRWPRSPVSFAGKRVGVIGTGSSGIQSIPVIAETAKHLTVFQRTPNHSIPAKNRKVTPEELAQAKADVKMLRDLARANAIGWGVYVDPPTFGAYADMTPEEREARLSAVWEAGGLFTYLTFTDQFANMEAAKAVGDMIGRRIREVVKDPATAELLIPTTLIGCKRICCDTGYYETYNLPHVKLVSVKSNPIVRVVNGDSLELGDGTVVGPFDMLVCATGFDALTGAASQIDIVGKNGLTLKEAWKDGDPTSYLGVFVHGFPNMMQVNGPGSPSVLSNMLSAIEQQDEWLDKLIAKADDEGIKALEATTEAQEKWQEKVDSYQDTTIFGGCNSWYLGANVPGKKKRILPFLGGIPLYGEITEDVLNSGFKGLEVTK
ncbi:putative oxidoreductase [Hyaloraphidium curvatum]|nr:putative oxidoreductase [Hyaloraphidium curvatum]